MCSSKLDGVGECRDRQRRWHPRTDRVADDALGEHVLDEAGVELSFRGLVLGDVGDPELVRPGRREVPLDEVVMDRGSGTTVEPSLLGVVRPEPLG